MRLSLLLLCGWFSLTLANASIAASWEVKFKDGRVVTVEAPVGANGTQIGFLAIEKLRAQDADQALQNEVETEEPSEIRPARKEETGTLTPTASSFAAKEQQERRLTDDEKAEKDREWDLRYKIFTRCYIDKMSGVPESSRLEPRVDYQCREMSADPSLFQKWKYLYFW